MPSTPVRVYLVQSSDGHISLIFSNKRKLVDFLWIQKAYRPMYLNSYKSFSELLKWNPYFETELETGHLSISRIYVNPSVSVLIPPVS